MLRQTLLYLSGHRQFRRWVEQSPLSAKLTHRFVAGFSLEDEIRVVRSLSTQGIFASLDFLGENVHSLAEAEQSRDSFLRALAEIKRTGLSAATVSVKLSQMGLNISEDACFENVSALAEYASQLNTRVEIDMESSEYTDRTLAMVTRLEERFRGAVRAVIQAYLFRSETDIRMLAERGIPVRLCKGAYNEPPSIAYSSKSQVDRNYERLLRLLIDIGNEPAIASHDEKIVRSAVQYARAKGLPAAAFEFQMLYGIRRDLQKELVAEGFRLRLYVPYGDAWYPYFMRRLAERPANLLFLARNLIRS
jgi:proline dehydrogenase